MFYLKKNCIVVFLLECFSHGCLCRCHQVAVCSSVVSAETSCVRMTSLNIRPAVRDSSQKTTSVSTRVTRPAPVKRFSRLSPPQTLSNFKISRIRGYIPRSFVELHIDISFSLVTNMHVLYLIAVYYYFLLYKSVLST